MNDKKEYKRFYCCGDCVHYDMRKHKCKLGAHITTDAHRNFYDDCQFPTYIEDSEAKHALEKQIPKKPDFWGDGYSDGELVYDTWICPNCGGKYELEFEEYAYCPKCGQAIDWSEDNDTTN